MTRVVAALVTAFVVAVIALWIRHHRAREQRIAHLADLVATARVNDAARIEAIQAAMKVPFPAAPQPCPLRTRSKIVRLETVDAPGGSLHEVVAAAAELREPAPWPHELDVIGDRAFLWDYGAKRVVCVGRDADDPHGTLVAR